MSLEQVKEIIRMPWGKLQHDAGISGKAGEQQGESRRQSACVSIRIPAQIQIRNSSGNSESYNARTVLVNQRGARFECPLPYGPRPSKQRRFKVNELLWIEVPSTGKSAGGEVVWADTHPNLNGNFEFAVELDESKNLFDVAFPLQESDEAQTTTLTAPPRHRETPTTSRGGDSPMTSRLADVIQEVIASAVEKEEGAAAERLVREVHDHIGRAQQAAFENLRQEIEQQASAMEEQLLQQCRARAEKMLSTTLVTAMHSLSDQIDEMAARTEERVRGIFSSLEEQLEQRSAKALAETTSRIAAEMENSTGAAHAAIVQKVLEEINEKQKGLMEQVQRQIGIATEQNLMKLRGGLTRTLQELTEASQNGNLAL